MKTSRTWAPSATSSRCAPATPATTCCRAAWRRWPTSAICARSSTSGGWSRKSASARLSAAETLAKQLRERASSITARAGEEGKLFGSVTNIDIERALADQGLTRGAAAHPPRRADQDARRAHGAGDAADRREPGELTVTVAPLGSDGRHALPSRPGPPQRVNARRPARSSIACDQPFGLHRLVESRVLAQVLGKQRRVAVAGEEDERDALRCAGARPAARRWRRAG